MISWGELPRYASPLSFVNEKDRIRVRENVKQIAELRDNFDREDVLKLQKFITSESLTEEEAKLNEFRKKIYNINTDTTDLSYVFLFCQAELSTVLVSMNDSFLKDKLKNYLGKFKDLDRLKDILDILITKPYNAGYFKLMLQRLTSPYKQSMCEFIKLTQLVTKVFSANREEDIFGRDISNLEEQLKSSEEKEV